MPDNHDKLLLSIPGVSHLTFADEELIRLSFPKDSVQYARSFLYLLRAAHGDHGTLGFKYISRNLTAVIGCRNNLLYLTPITDVTYGKQLKELCEQISAKTTRRLLIKKYSPDAYPHMKRIKRIQLKEKDLEDDAYSETVLILSRIFVDLKGTVNPSASKFMKQLRRFNRLKLHYTTADEINPGNLYAVKQFLEKDPHKYANYLPLVHYLCKHGKDVKYRVMIFMAKDTVEGLYITEVFSLSEAGLYCAVTAKNKPGITEWMDWYFFHKLHTEGIKTLYFGGSETKGVAYYIKKLNPINPSYFVETIEYDSSTR